MTKNPITATEQLAPGVHSPSPSPRLYAQAGCAGGFAFTSAEASVFSPHGACLQTLLHAERGYGLSDGSLSLGACHALCSSEAVYALRCLMTGGLAKGWTLRNDTGVRLQLEQCFNGSKELEPAAKALTGISRVTLEPEGGLTPWRPIVTGAQEVNLKLGVMDADETVSLIVPFVINIVADYLLVLASAFTRGGLSRHHQLR